jgi:hypothetical protein
MAASMGRVPAWFSSGSEGVVCDHVHQIIQRIIRRGQADGTITRAVAPHDIVVFGAMLAQPRRPDSGWDATCRRLLATYLAGLSADTSDG